MNLHSQGLSLKKRRCVMKNKRGDELQSVNSSAVSRRGFLKAGAGLGAMAATGLALDGPKTDAQVGVPSPGQFPLKGYSLPLSPKGQSSIVDAPPWHYGGDVLLLTFKADAKRAATFIPPPLELGSNPGQGFVGFAEWVSVSEGRPDLAFTNPERANYRECFVALACQYKGEPGAFIPCMWVDNDYSLARGFIQGFPKKLGRIYVTRLHGLNPKVGGRQIGARVRGICDVNAQRIVEGSTIFTRAAQPSDIPSGRVYLMRHFPSIENPTRPAVHELLVLTVSNVMIKDVWSGEAQIKFFESPFEEVADLGAVEAQGAFFYSMGMTITGGKVIHKYV
jgi:acetoacetate decarboxylase